MDSGKIISFNPTRHYGFIRSDSGGEDVMLHERELARGQSAALLKRDVRVTYDLEHGSRGLRAANVRVVQPQAEARERVPVDEDEFRDQMQYIVARAGAVMKDEMVALARRRGWIR